MKKGTARLIKGITQFPGDVVTNAGHALGIAAKPVYKTTTREYMDLISEIYFNPEAIEQIGNTLNGRPDKKGPLSKAKKEMVLKNPTIAELVKKMCIERAVSEETEHTRDSLFEGLNLSGSVFGKKTDEYKDFLASRDRIIKSILGDRINFNEFVSQFGKVMSASMAYSKKMIVEIDKVMVDTAEKPKWEEQRKKFMKKVEQPTIATIEKMNGSETHISQAESFIDFLDRKHDMRGIQSGPYSYSELVKMAVLHDSRICVSEMSKLQNERVRSDSSEVQYPKKMTDDEKKRIEDAKRNSETQMVGVAKKYKDSLASGEVESLSDYATSISDLANDEFEAKQISSRAVLSVNNAIANRMYVEELKDRLDATAKFQEDYDEHHKAMMEIGREAGLISNISGIYEEMEELLANRSGYTVQEASQGNIVQETTKKVVEVLSDKSSDKGKSVEPKVKTEEKDSNSAADKSDKNTDGEIR